MHIAWPQSRSLAPGLIIDNGSGLQEGGGRGEEGEEEVAEGAGGEDDGIECVQCGNKNEAEEPV